MTLEFLRAEAELLLDVSEQTDRDEKEEAEEWRAKVGRKEETEEENE